MEGKKGKSCSSSSSSSSSAAAAGGFYGEEKTGKNSSSSSTGLFNSVFPRPSSMERKGSSHSDIFGPPRKQGYADQAWINPHGTNGDETYKDNTSKGNKERSTAYQSERSDPCFLSNSLYYGGQDICAAPPSSHSSGSSYNKDGKDDSVNGSDFASRGNWWQGSLYY